MVLNYIWIAFFLIAFLVACVKLVFFGDTLVFPAIVNSTFEISKTAFEISLGLTGVLTLWLGIMKIGEKGGVVNVLSRIVGPFFSRLFPEIPKNHPAVGQMMMNFSANMLGLDNAATPIGLKAMDSLQELNPKKDTASNSQIMFLVLNTSGLTLIPVSVMVYRAQANAANPTDVFIPILLATFFSTLVGIIVTAIYQKINLFNKVFLSWILGISAGIFALIFYLKSLPQEQMEAVSNIASSMILFGIIIAFISSALIKRVNVYESFIEGAKEGFQIAIKIIPYLVAILVAIGVFRASGAMDWMINGFTWVWELTSLNSDWIPALPTAIMKPLSGSGARGMMLDVFASSGADSFSSRVAATIQGATDTTFYIIAVYFGAVNIKNTRYAVTCGLIADLAGIIAAVLISYIFFY